ncbi:nuclease [Streptomyces naphthomycinicus]|uniref:nuclease n=1 Tax=Streptomyces naphthomycinicus TaxID=2872625 RepID=UPI001CED90FC|nr:nuclease [Streptomyces sp. TML10]
MPMLLIKGKYEVIGGRSDGDTVHFTPDTPSEWDLVPGPHKVKHNGAGRAKLRLDAIDALETHFQRGGPEVSQPLKFARQARDELVKWIGFTSVERAEDDTVTAATPESVPGWILTGGAALDKRCIALAGKGTPPGTSGTLIAVDVPLLRTTLNHHMIAAGLVYPTFYRNLFADLRDELTAASHAAQSPVKKGLWAEDVTTSGATVTGLDSLTHPEHGAVILPKLFRRLVEYLNLGNPDLAGFAAFLDAAADKYWILSTGQAPTGLDTVVEVNGTKVKMTHPPEDLVFDEG